MKLCNSCINCSMLMSVIWLVLLLHTVTHKICQFERKFVFTNNLKANQTLWHSRTIAIIPTVKYPAAISGAVQHFGQIRNQKWIVTKAGYLANQPEPHIQYILVPNLCILSGHIDSSYHLQHQVFFCLVPPALLWNWLQMTLSFPSNFIPSSTVVLAIVSAI